LNYTRVHGAALVFAVPAQTWYRNG